MRLTCVDIFHCKLMRFLFGSFFISGPFNTAIAAFVLSSRFFICFPLSYYLLFDKFFCRGLSFYQAAYICNLL